MSNTSQLPVDSKDTELREQLQAELDEFVLFTDNTPESNEPTELSVFLRQCGYTDVMERLGDDLMQLFKEHTERHRQEAYSNGWRNAYKEMHDSIDWGKRSIVDPACEELNNNQPTSLNGEETPS